MNDEARPKQADHRAAELGVKAASGTEKCKETQTRAEGFTEQLLLEQLNWYRIQRHDFLNHWQVIMGYLQLKQADKALDYMKTALNVEAEQRAGQIADPLVRAVVLGMMLRLRLEGFLAEIVLPNTFKAAEYWQRLGTRKYAETLYGYTTECLELCRSCQQGLDKRDRVLALMDFGDESGKILDFRVYRIHEGTQGEKCLAGRVFQLDLDSPFS